MIACSLAPADHHRGQIVIVFTVFAEREETRQSVGLERCDSACQPFKNFFVLLVLGGRVHPMAISV
jgi:hypothetical protein